MFLPFEGELRPLFSIPVAEATAPLLISTFEHSPSPSETAFLAFSFHF